MTPKIHRLWTRWDYYSGWYRFILFSGSVCKRCYKSLHWFPSNQQNHSFKFRLSPPQCYLHTTSGSQTLAAMPEINFIILSGIKNCYLIGVWQHLQFECFKHKETGVDSPQISRTILSNSDFHPLSGTHIPLLGQRVHFSQCIKLFVQRIRVFNM